MSVIYTALTGALHVLCTREGFPSLWTVLQKLLAQPYDRGVVLPPQAAELETTNFLCSFLAPQDTDVVSVSVLSWIRMSAFFSAHVDRQLVFAFSVAQRKFCAMESTSIYQEGFFTLLAAGSLQQ